MNNYNYGKKNASIAAHLEIIAKFIAQILDEALLD